MLLAIDFGTWNSSAALMVNGKVTPIKEPLRGSSYSFPSSVYLTEQGEFLVGVAAENCRMRDITRYRQQFKRALGQNQPYQIGNLVLNVEDVVAEVLKKLKSEAEKTVSESISDAVITVPAAYKSSKRELMLKAAKIAGFSRVSLLEEPVAAAFYYTQQNNNSLAEGDVILVYDFGGGTFDATLIKKVGNSFQVLGMPIGVENCGGVDFDRKIRDDILNRCNPILGQQFRLKESFRQRMTISDFCVHIKHQLSEATEAVIDIPIGGTAVESYQLNRSDFDRMISPFVDRTIKTCDSLLQQAGLGWQDVKEVLMVGGSCRIPYIKETLAQKLGRKPLLVNDPELAVCMGAANINNVQVNGGNGVLEESQEKIKSVISILQRISTLIGINKGKEIVNLKSGAAIIPGLGYSSKSQTLNKEIYELEKGVFKLIVIGEFSHGKSTLINALLGQSLLPAKSAPATAIATMLVYGDSDRVCIYSTDKLNPITMSWDNFKEIFQLKEDNDDKDKIEPDKFKNVKYAEIERKYNLLAKGVRLIDSPGLKEDSIRTKITEDFLKESHAIIFLLNATQLLNEDEQKFIKNKLFSQSRENYIDNKFIRNRLENVFFVINKFDQIDEQEVDENKQRTKNKLKDIFCKETGEFDEELYQRRVFFVSSKNALNASKTNDAQLLRKSGIPQLERKIEEFLASPAKTISIIEPVYDRLLLNLSELYKDIPHQKEALDKSLDELEERHNQNKEKFGKLQYLLNDINNTIRGGGEIKRKVYNSLKEYIKDMERNWDNDSKTFIHLNYISTGNIFDLVTPWKADDAKRRLNDNLTAEIKEYIKVKLNVWTNQINDLIAPDIKEMSEEWLALVGEFQSKIDEIKIGFSGDNGKYTGVAPSKILNIFNEVLGNGVLLQQALVASQIINVIVPMIANILVTIIAAIITGIMAIIVLIVIGIIPAIIVLVIGAIITWLISLIKP